MQQENPQHWQAWREAAGREDIDAAIRAIYADLGQAVAQRRPVCNASGRCCRFEEFGHRLYVTGLEIAWFLRGVANRDSASGQSLVTNDLSLKQLAPGPKPQASSLPNCPYQIDGLCSTHAIRPLGCRVFFCEQGTEDWQQDTTEHFLNRLKELHAAHGLPYSYMEWRAGLDEASVAFEDPI